MHLNYESAMLLRSHVRAEESTRLVKCVNSFPQPMAIKTRTRVDFDDFHLKSSF